MGEGKLGATYLGAGNTAFLVWAPQVREVQVRLLGPETRLVRLEPAERGYFAGTASDVLPGQRYLYRLDGQTERPDPAARFQPQGVHGPSQVVDTAFEWQDTQWRGLPLADYVIYELHIGAFTPQGTFLAAIARLDDLAALGVTAIEIMPVAQFPGERNWGYDGVYSYAPQNSYGGPAGLKQLISECHRRGLAVVLDVVYNHLGPEGNYLADFGSYFTDRYRTPWGPAINFDGPGSDEVRRFFLENARYWIEEFHVDALRLDAIHAVFDITARPFLEELGELVRDTGRQLGRPVYTIAESNRNDSRVVRPVEHGGIGLDAQWIDDFARAWLALLSGERFGFYADFGCLQSMANAYAGGYVLTGQTSIYRGRRHGRPSGDVTPEQFIAFSQHHDLVGNRLEGDRLSQRAGFEQLKLTAAAVILGPYVPLLFMGEEYGETAPFYYFVDHSDPALLDAVRAGRRREFTAFRWQGDPPDPASAETFQASKLNPKLAEAGEHRRLREFYRELLRLRRCHTSLSRAGREQTTVSLLADEQVLACRRTAQGESTCLLLNPSAAPAVVELGEPSFAGPWRKLLGSADSRWQAAGERPEPLTSFSTAIQLAPWSCALLVGNSGAML